MKAFNRGYFVFERSDKDDQLDIIRYDEIMPSKELPSFKYEYVDLGLPSGRKWAKCNLGASAPYELGEWYAWGEKKIKFDYTWSNYKWGDKKKLTKYCQVEQADYWAGKNTIDGDLTIDPIDDPVSSSLGWRWHMPSREDWQELKSHCKWSWGSEDGVKGMRVTGTNGNSIFLPAAGFYSDRNGGVGEKGFYWSSSLAQNPNEAYLLAFTSKSFSSDAKNDRSFGFSIRPVLYKETIDSTIIQPVDLGLSVKWANCNLGAASPEDYGDYYAWGELETKTDYSWSSYRWYKGDLKTFSKYNASNSNQIGDNKVVLDLQDDVAHRKLGGKWRIPTGKEWDELLEKCEIYVKLNNGVIGYHVVGPNGNSIFIPFAGTWDEAKVEAISACGCYWASTPYRSDPSQAIFSYIRRYEFDVFSCDRSRGNSVRPVME